MSEIMQVNWDSLTVTLWEPEVTYEIRNSVPRSAEFEFQYNGFTFYRCRNGDLVAVPR